MKIETKYEINDIVYNFLTHSKYAIVETKIKAITLDKYNRINYVLSDNSKVLEDEVFTSVEDCIQNQIDHYQRLLDKYRAGDELNIFKKHN